MDTTQNTLVCPPLAEIKEVERSWKWFLALGIFAILLGMTALGAMVVATLASVIFFGFLLLANGVVQGVHALKAYKGKELSLRLLAAVLYAVVGFWIIAKPAIGAASLTFLLAAFFLVGGIFRIIGALALRFRNWGWVVLNGVFTLFLGLLIWMNWPASSLWVIGLFIGIEMIIGGWSGVLFALGVRDEIGQVRRRCESQV